MTTQLTCTPFLSNPCIFIQNAEKGVLPPSSTPTTELLKLRGTLAKFVIIHDIANDPLFSYISSLEYKKEFDVFVHHLRKPFRSIRMRTEGIQVSHNFMGEAIDPAAVVSTWNTASTSPQGIVRQASSGPLPLPAPPRTPRMPSSLTLSSLSSRRLWRPAPLWPTLAPPPARRTPLGPGRGPRPRIPPPCARLESSHRSLDPISPDPVGKVSSRHIINCLKSGFPARPNENWVSSFDRIFSDSHAAWCGFKGKTWDRSLRHICKPGYERLINELAGSILQKVDKTRFFTAPGRVTIFTAHKDATLLRLIANCVELNKLFGKPPRLMFATTSELFMILTFFKEGDSFVSIAD